MYSLLSSSLFSFSCKSFGPQPHNELHMQRLVDMKQSIGFCKAPYGGGGPSNRVMFKLELLDSKPLAAQTILICVLYNIGHVMGCFVFFSHYTTKLYIETTWARWDSKQASFTKYRVNKRRSYLYMLLFRDVSKTLNATAQKSANRLLREVFLCPLPIPTDYITA